MWQDLAALTPPLVMCIAIIIAVVIFVRREMGSKRGGTRDARRRSRGPRS